MNNAPLFTRLDLPLSDRCNLDCSFCYTHGGCGNAYNQEHVDKCFDWFIGQFDANANPEQRKQGMTCDFFGGEPLMEWEHIKEIVLKQRARAAKLNTNIKFGVITNMTLLDADKLSWMLEHKIGIGPSVDGCALSQDAERKYHDGSGSSAIVYENARRMLARTEIRTCRYTVSPATVQYLYESILFLTKDLGFQIINFIAAGGVEWTDEKLGIFFEQVDKVTDWWIDEMRKGNYYDLYHLRNMFPAIWTGRRPHRLCGASWQHIGIDTNGNFYPCHRYLNLGSKPDSEYCLGNLQTGFTGHELRRKFREFDIAVYYKDRCKDCPAVLACNWICTHEMMVAGKGMFEPLPHYCKIWPFYWKMGMRAHSILTAENNQLYLQKCDPNYKQKQQQTQQTQQRQQQQVFKSSSGHGKPMQHFGKARK